MFEFLGWVLMKISKKQAYMYLNMQLVVGTAGFFFVRFSRDNLFWKPPVPWVFGTILLSFQEILLEFSIFWKNWLSFGQKSLSFWQILDQMLGFVAKLTLFSSENCIFKQFQGKTQLFLEFLMLCLLSFEQMALKTSGSLSFWAGNTLSFFRAWVFFTLSFSKTHKTSL